MKSLGNLLRKYISENGLTIYKAASLAGVNRTTLQKVLSDERNASEELIQKLLSVLKLSPAEKAELKELFAIQLMGEDIYLQRQYIKKSIESMAGLDNWFSGISGAVGTLSLLPDAESALPQDSALICGLSAVRQLLFTCASHMRRRGPGELLLYAPGNLPALKALLLSELSPADSAQPLELRHITPMIKVPAAEATPLTNLDILFHILPFTVSRHFRYRVYCFYSHELLPEPVQHAFPYYMVSGSMVILLSCDGQTALCLRRPEIVSHFRNLFLDSLGKTTSMMLSQTSPTTILQDMLDRDLSPGSLHTLEWQPCLSTFLTEDMVEKYVRPDLPGRDEIIRLGCARVRQLSSMENHSCIFSRSGMEDFVQTGVISDIPSQYAMPLEIPDRIRILKSMYCACEEDLEFLRLTNPITFRLSRYFFAALRGDDSLTFCGVDAANSTFNYIEITEPSFLEAFRDFYQYLPESGLICSKEETLKAIEESIRLLEEIL